MKKKYLCVAALGVLLVGLIVAATNKERYQIEEEELQTEESAVSVIEKYEAALSGGTDLRFWYDDASYESYFMNMAANYYNETGVLVELSYIDAMDYVGELFPILLRKVNTHPEMLHLP